MKHQSKLSQEQQYIAEHQAVQQTGREFASAEEVLRHDATQTTVPPEIAKRLKRSTANLPPQKGGWFKRFFN